MYRFYLKQGETQFLFPVTPSQVQTKVGNCNETVQILQMGQANLLKNAGLEEVRFRALFPGRQYHFVQVEEGFREPSYFGTAERFQKSPKACTAHHFPQAGGWQSDFLQQCGNGSGGI